MATKKAGMGAAFVVLAAVLGLISIIGVILLMMLFEPGIEHSPSQGAALSVPRAITRSQNSSCRMFVPNISPYFGAKA